MANIPCTHTVTTAEVAAARASVREMSRLVQAAKAAAGPDAMLVAWLSDFHFFAPRDYGDEDLGTYATFRDPRAIAHLAFEELKALHPVPDFLIYGGDMVNSGHRVTPDLLAEGPPDEYAALRLVLDAHAPPDIPSVLLLGNHDHGDHPLSPAFHRDMATWARPGWPGTVETDDYYWSAVRNGWRFIALDTRHMQRLTERQRRWLGAQLADTSLPTIILQHRPFLRCGNVVDEFRLIDSETLALITNAPCVSAVISGHTHKATAWNLHGQAHIIFPALAYGIDDAQGWGCFLLQRGRPPVIFSKALAVQFEDGVRVTRGAVRQLAIAPYNLDDPAIPEPGTSPPPRR